MIGLCIISRGKVSRQKQLLNVSNWRLNANLRNTPPKIYACSCIFRHISLGEKNTEPVILNYFPSTWFVNDYIAKNWSQVVHKSAVRFIFAIESWEKWWLEINFRCSYYKSSSNDKTLSVVVFFCFSFCLIGACVRVCVFCRFRLHWI